MKNKLLTIAVLGLSIMPAIQVTAQAEKTTTILADSLSKEQLPQKKADGLSWKDILSSFLSANDKKEQSPTFKLGGYIIGDYTYYSDESKDKNAGFSIRNVRLYFDGRVLNDFVYHLQMEMSGSPGVDKGVRLLNAYAEWNKYPFFKVRMGQFKRPFTFENPTHVWNVGFGTYSQATTKLAGMSDRVGEHSSGGRDIGVQLSGDLFPSAADGHRFFHYQVGLFNGQGLNHKDANRNKDLIGGLWIAPLKELRIGAFGWTGKYTASITELGDVKVDRNRLAFGVDYESDWVFRCEYITSEGGKANTAANYKYASNHSDAWYAMLGVPATDKLKIYGKWDVYRDEKTNDSKTSIYAISFNYRLMKDLMFQLSYAFNQARSVLWTGQNRTTSESNYNQITFQTYIRF